MTKPKRTLGEVRIGIDFNVGGNPDIAVIKRKAADFIDAVDAIWDAGNAPATAAAILGDNHLENGEIVRLKKLAQTEIESAAMWAVKAAARSATAKASLP